MTKMRTIGLLLGVMAGLAIASTASAEPSIQLKAERIPLSPESRTQELLTGPPQTGGMRSGRVVLKAGEAMKRHSTHGNEELLVFLSGRAKVVLGSEPVEMAGGEVLYIPPHVEHEVRNDSAGEVRYIYIVAPVR
jgi:mannose-6-phosphate isomerase-like protein (cupin superfamily)